MMEIVEIMTICFLGYPLLIFSLLVLVEKLNEKYKDNDKDLDKSDNIRGWDRGDRNPVDGDGTPDQTPQ